MILWSIYLHCSRYLRMMLCAILQSTHQRILEIIREHNLGQTVESCDLFADEQFDAHFHIST